MAASSKEGMNMTLTRPERPARRTTAAIAAVFLIVTVAPQTASAASTGRAGTDQEVQEVINELAVTGQISQAGRLTLASRPDVAASIVDPQSSEAGSDDIKEANVPVSVRQRDAANNATAAATTCGAWRDAWVRYRTVLGSTAYKFHQYMRWCFNGASVTRIENRYPYLSDNNGFEFYRGLIGDSVGHVPAGEVYSFMQGNIENCVIKYGCISTSYPWVKIWAGNNGSSKWASGL
jgi:archaellin